MKIKPISTLVTLLCLNCQTTPAKTKDIPKLLLAKEFSSITNLSNYLVSEKLDGVRAFWNGKQLVTRKGNLINAPQWFISSFPEYPLDGELWISRGKFDLVSGTVRKIVPIDKEWKQVKYMVFDMPAEITNFDKRFNKLQSIIQSTNSEYLKAVSQVKISSNTELDSLLESIVQKGGEGLMLHKINSIYQHSRSHDLQKLKPHLDAEAKVIAFIPGRGEFKGLMGSMLVETKSGLQFKIGTGFTIEQRRNPPKKGQTVTYRYRGLTKNGIPRFASFLRIREEF